MKKVELTQGKFALVDDEDFTIVTTHRWYAAKSSRGYSWYARTKINGKAVEMHRFIMNFPNCPVDHKDENGLNNQKYNLRKCTNAQNVQNSSTVYGESSYKGVDFHCGKWRARIGGGSKRENLGHFKEEKEAARAYDSAALRIYGSDAKLNFTGE